MPSALLHLARCLAPLAFVLVLAACDSPEERAETHYLRGQELLAEGVPEKALLEFRNALQLNERHAGAHFAVGEMMETRGDFGMALAHFTQASEIDPQITEAWFKRAQIQLLANNVDQALRNIERFLVLEPGRAEGHALLATLKVRQGDLTAARQALDNALAIAPGNAEVAAVEISWLLEAEGPAPALARADAAIANHPENLPLYILRLQILEQSGAEAAVGQHLKTTVDVFPENTRLRHALARWALATGENETAVTQLRVLVDTQPGDMATVFNLLQVIRQTDGDDAVRTELDRLISGAAEPLALELVRARFDSQSGQRDAAISRLRYIAAQTGPEAAQARVALAQMLDGDGEREEARALVDQVLAQDPGNVDALVLRVSWQVDEDSLEDAAATVRAALTEAPEDVRLLMLDGRIQELSGNIELASDRIAKAVRLDGYRPATVENYVRFLTEKDRLRAAETILTEAADRHPGSTRLLDFLASVRIQLGNWQGAEAAVRALTQAGDEERARQLSAAILIGQERFEEGTALLLDLPEDARRRANSIATLIETYLRTGQVEEVEKLLNQLLAENPEDLQALGIRGNIKLANGDLEGAEAMYRQVLEIDPDNSGAWSALARVAARQGNEEKSGTLLREGLLTSPDNLLLLARLAEFHEAQGDYANAIDTYERLYELVPASLLVANNLASLLSDHHADDPAAVDRAYRIASRLRGTSLPHYQDTYGWTRYLKGEHEEALEYISAAAKALPQNPWVGYHLGMVYLALGQAEEARAVLQETLARVIGTGFPATGKIRVALASISGG